jgi:O-antigen/teichoic acid export membrane protein
MATTPSLTVSFVWTLAGSLVYSGSQWAIIVLLAKLGTPAMVGQYAFAAAIAYPVSLIANLQLRAVFINDHEGRYPFRRMLATRYLLAAFAWFVLLLTCAFTFSNTHATALLLLVGTSMLVDSLSESYFSLLQKSERMDRIARSMISRSFLSLSMAAVALYFTHRLLYAVCGILLGRLMVLIFYDTATETFRITQISREETPTSGAFLERFRPLWNLRSQWGMIWVALPLGGVSVLSSLYLNIPRYMIEHYLGPRELGIYSALNYIPYAALVFASALGYVSYARLSRMYFEWDIRGFKLLLGKMMLIALSLGVSGFLMSAIIGRPILRILYRPEYAEHVDLLLWLVATAGVSCLATCVGVAMTAASQFRPQIPLFLTISAVSVTTAFLLVPRFGLYGAAIAAMASLIVQVIGSSWIVYRALKRRSLPVAEQASASSVVANAFASNS